MCSGPKQGLTLPASVDLEKETVITGRVVDGDGQAVGGAFVRLLDSSDEFTAEVVASATGDFRFFAAPGSWTLRALSAAGNGDAVVQPSGAGIHEVDVKIAGQPGGPIVRTGQITPRAIASILGHTARCQRNRTCPLVFGRNRDAARLPPAHPTSLAASAATGKHPPHRRACRGNQDRQIRLTHHVQDAGATPAPGSGDDDPSARPAARSARVRLLAAWVGVRTPAPPPGADSDHPDHRPHHSKPGRDRPGCAVRKCRFSDT